MWIVDVVVIVVVAVVFVDVKLAERRSSVCKKYINFFCVSDFFI